MKRFLTYGKRILIAIVCFTALFFIAQYSVYADFDQSEDIVYKTLTYTNDTSKPYNTALSNEAQRQIDQYLWLGNYTFDHILAIADPYQTNTNALNIYFKTEEAVSVTYTIHVEASNISDFTRTLKNDDKSGYTTDHAYQLIGLIPDMDNIITLKLTDKNGNIVNQKSFTYHAGPLKGKEDVQLKLEKGTSTEALSNGLYTVLGNDSDDQDFVYLYDNEGVLRSEMPINGYRSHRMLFDEDYLYMSVSQYKMAKLSRLGRVEEVYKTGSYEIHHDYVFDETGNILILATDTTSETEEDLVIRLNLKTGEIHEILDLADLFGDYKKTAALPKDADTLDWMHINTLQLMDDHSILLSSRETSTIIKIKDYDTSPSIDYMIGNEEFWTASGYDSNLLSQEGEFVLQSGQHTVTYVADDDLPEGQYYVYMFNNNNTISATRPDFDWKTYYPGTGTAVKGDASYYYRYLVDETARTFTLVDSMPVDYSGYVSSAQEYEGNLIVDSGMANTFTEYDAHHELIAKFTIQAEKFIYRIYKYTYEGFWFQ
ncbi:MAG: aryl-sulfate sulfotransferase [Erysipelotrichaceae bacterium]|nr:aryl-sulfate sulfotransferase [Erysipelotrichaceae bacterium]